MRSPWLSREYTKAEDICLEKLTENKKTYYLLKNPKYKTELKITEEEYKKFNNNDFNEIEWEKYFLRGFAIDKNGFELVIENNGNFPKSFKKSDTVSSFPLKVLDEKYFILINPDLGSWIALNKQEFDRYQNNELTTYEWESLFIRGLAQGENGFGFEVETPSPADYPSVVVVNITTNCNLRCKYCFADCGPFVGEDMTEDVMEQVIKNMLDMPVKMVTFEFQGGEASMNVKGIKQFIEMSEEIRKNSDKVVKYRTEMNCVEISDELASLLKKYEVSTGVSLDGPKELNDQYRVDEKGQGSFDRIMAGVQKIRDYGVSIDGSVCTIGQHNVKYPKEIMKFFDSIGISFKPRPINILGREIENNLTTKDGEWSKCYSEMHEMKDEVSIDNFSTHIYEENVYTPIRDYICLRYPCGAAREIISVNPDGTVYPCDGFKGEEKFIMGNIKNETLREMLAKPNIIKLRSRVAKDIKKCSTCLFRGMCCSCCYSAYGKFGDVYREDPHCNDKRQIYIYLIQYWLRKNDVEKVKK